MAADDINLDKNLAAGNPNVFVPPRYPQMNFSADNINHDEVHALLEIWAKAVESAIVSGTYSIAIYVTKEP